MKIVLYSWGCNSDNGLKQSLLELGHEVLIYDHKCVHYSKDLKMARGLINLIHEGAADAVISYDYFPIISMVCNTAGIIYYSWVYDCPHYTLFAKTAFYDCNRIGCFDKALVERLNGLGINTVFHLPLGVDWSDKEAKEDGAYKCDVSFLGSLYTDKYNYFDTLDADELFVKKANKCIDEQCFDYKNDHMSSFFQNSSGEADHSILNEIKNILINRGLMPGEEYIEDTEYIFASSFLDKKVTVQERKNLLERIAGQSYDFRLYTGSDLTGSPALKAYSRGYADYSKTMPKIFRSSRININISLRSIKTGIPLRVLDIMGCGGFLLSNYQKELAESFIEGEEVVMFYDLDDCLEKISYYLQHEDERSRIARAGHKAVRERFNRKKLLKDLISN